MARAGAAVGVASASAAVLAAVLVGLPAAAHAQGAPAWPAWVLEPPPAGELAGADCVEASGNLSIDRQQVTAKARLVLAQQIEVRIEAMDETFASRAGEGKAERLAVSFKSASRQLVATTLQGSRLVRFEIVGPAAGGSGGLGSAGGLVCGQVAIERRRAEALPDDIIRTAGAKVDDDTESLLLARFRQVAAARRVAGESKP